MPDDYQEYYPHQPYIYLQYASQDAERVSTILDVLNESGCNVRCDENFSTDDKSRNIEYEEMEQASLLIVCYSKAASKSKIVKGTVHYAAKLPELNKVCICLDDTPFGFFFRDCKKHYSVFQNTDKEQLMAALRPYLNDVLDAALDDGFDDVPYDSFDDAWEEIGDTDYIDELTEEPVEELSEDDLSDEEWLEDIDTDADEADIEDGFALAEQEQDAPFDPPFQEEDDFALSEQEQDAPFDPPFQEEDGFALSEQEQDAPFDPPFEEEDDFALSEQEQDAPFDPPFEQEDGFALSEQEQDAPFDPPFEEEDGFALSEQEQDTPFDPPVYSEDAFALLTVDTDSPAASSLTSSFTFALPDEEQTDVSFDEPAGLQEHTTEGNLNAAQEPMTQHASDTPAWDKSAVWQNVRQTMHRRATGKMRLVAKHTPHPTFSNTQEQADEPAPSIQPIQLEQPTECTPASPIEVRTPFVPSPEMEAIEQQIEISTFEEPLSADTLSELPEAMPPIQVEEQNENADTTEESTASASVDMPSEHFFIEYPTDDDTIESIAVTYPEPLLDQPMPAAEPQTASDKPMPEAEPQTASHKPMTEAEPQTASDKPMPEAEPQTASHKPMPEAEPQTASHKPMPEAEPETDKEDFDTSDLNSYAFFTQNILTDMDHDSSWNGEGFFCEPPQEEPSASLPVEMTPEPSQFQTELEFTSTPDNHYTAPDMVDVPLSPDMLKKQPPSHSPSDEEDIPDIKIQLYIKAAEQGNADAQYKLGLSYERGDHVEQNYIKAAHWYILSSNRGNANAQFNLAGLYEKGLGVSQNLREAADLYRQAAEQGHSNAQMHYGICLKKGIGVEKDVAQSVTWFLRASEKGNAAAIYHLGMCFEFGQGVERDYSHALQLYLTAANQDYAEAQNALANCYFGGHGVPANYTEAVRWYSKAARNGSVSAQFNIGFCCENGIGIEQNTDMAYRFYRIAADNGSQQAIGRLKELGFNA